MVGGVVVLVVLVVVVLLLVLPPWGLGAVSLGLNRGNLPLKGPHRRIYVGHIDIVVTLLVSLEEKMDGTTP